LRAREQIYPVDSTESLVTISVAPKTTAEGLVDAADVCERDFYAVIRVTGNADQAFRRYTAQTFPPEDPEPTTTRTALFEGHKATVVGNYAWKVTLLTGGDLATPFIKLDACS
jgi:hypothetical protein